MLALLKRHRDILCLVASLLLLAGIGWLDMTTGYQMSLVLLYSVPIAFAGYTCDRYTPFALATLACVVWCWADLGSGHEYFSAFVHAWEVCVRSVFFFVVAIAVVAVKDRQEESRARLSAVERARKIEHQVAAITEYEQQRIGREMHDGLSQYLAAVSCAMTALKIDIEKSASPALAVKAAEIEKLLSESVNQTHDLARSLAPVYHKGPGLAAALYELAATTSRRAGIPCSFESVGEESITQDGIATYLYRIAQEAVANAVRHGKAHEIVVQLSAAAGAVNLSISDDGIGFSDSSRNGDGVGLSVMNYRAGMIGGELVIEDRASGGTTVSCAVLSETTGKGAEI